MDQSNYNSTAIIELIVREIEKVIIGKDEIVRKVLMGILAKGHILIEDIPGVGKTTLALAVSKVMELDYRRMQFTPDVLPSDVIGFQMLSHDGTSEYHPGSVMCNLFLADEINRTSSKTQSALLEVMEEAKVTVDGMTREVPQPFHVIATQNPIGSVGTQMLPESQMDRFMIRISMGYPDIQSEIALLKDRHSTNPMDQVEQVITKAELQELQRKVEQIFIHDAVYEYIARLVNKTRENPLLELGISPRGTLALTNMAKACAFMAGRNYMIPDDVKSVFCEVAAHRMRISPKSRIGNYTIEQIIDEILGSVAAPRLIKK